MVKTFEVTHKTLLKTLELAKEDNKVVVINHKNNFILMNTKDIAINKRCANYLVFENIDGLNFQLIMTNKFEKAMSLNHALKML